MLRLRTSSIGVRLLRVTTRDQVRCCSALPKSPESEAASSKRKEFRKIDLDMNMLSRLDSMNVGFIPKRRMRVAVAQKLNPHSYRITDDSKRHGNDDEYEKSIPFPFRGTGKVLHTASNALEIPATIPGVPPEIALIGRSNVGKSTLLNALLGFDNSYVQKAIVSDKPGETKYLTFFQLGMSYKPPPKGKRAISSAEVADPQNNEPEKLVKTPALMFVDMPGYGFAFMSEEEKLRCHMLCLDYLISNTKRNKVLKRVVLLLDGRHGLKASDIMFLQDLQQHLISSVIADSPEKTAADLRKVFPAASAVKSLSHSTTEEEDTGAAPVTISMAAKTTKLLSQHLGWKLQIVLTKCDLVDRTELCRRITEVSKTVSEKLPALYHSMLPTLALSAMQLRGVQEMQRDLAALVPPKWEGAPNNRKPEPVEDVKDSKGDLPHNRGKFATADRKVDATTKKAIVKAAESDRLSFSERRKQREEELTGKVSVAEPAKRSERTAAADTKKKNILFEDSDSDDAESPLFKPTTTTRADKKASTTLVEASSSSASKPNTSKSADNKASKAADNITEKPVSTASSTSGKADKTDKASASVKGKPAANADKKGVPRVPKKKHQLLEDYSDELDDYFGDSDLDIDELMDSDGFDSDYELEDGTDDYYSTRGTRGKGSARYLEEAESDDEGVNWAAAGEYGDDFSDDDDELIQEELLQGNVNGYRRTLNTSKHSRPKARAVRAKPAAAAEKSDSKRAGKSGDKGDSSEGASKGRGRVASSSEKGAGKGDKVLPRRVPKTAENPKGRHRLAKPEDLDPAKARGATAAKGMKGAAAGKAGVKGGTRSGAKPKSEKAPRRRYY